jgi:phosphoribosylpyrophosphate synthetase
MNTDKLCLFALNASRKFGASVAKHLGAGLSAHEETDLADGEHKARPLHDTREKDVFVVRALHTDSHQSTADKRCRLLFFLGAIGHASHARRAAVIPYLCYARQDGRSHSQDPGKTMVRAAQSCHDAGAAHVNGAAGLGLFLGEAATLVNSRILDRTTITHTAPPWRLDPARVPNDIVVLDATHLFASAIGRTQGESS